MAGYINNEQQTAKAIHFSTVTTQYTEQKHLRPWMVNQAVTSADTVLRKMI